MDIDQEFRRICSECSDINEHCHILKYLGGHHSHLTEFGVRYGTSTIALLAGRPANLISYDLVKLIDVKAFQDMAPDTNFAFHQEDDLDIDIVETEVLFIDTLHTASQLYRELSKHGDKVLAHIVLHDTTTFGSTGEDGLPGLNFAISKYLLDTHPLWRVDKYFPNNNGLTILSRQGISFPESI